MRLVSFETAGGPGWGAVVGDGGGAGIVELGARIPGLAGVAELFAAGALDQARDIVELAQPDLALADVKLARPVPRPGKIVCVGVNYAERNEEYRDGSERPRYPSLFMRTPGSLVAHGEPIVRPPESVQLDYEGEIAIVIGRAGRRIPRERALQHVGGLTCVNEGTIRDWLRHGKFNVTQGKNFERSGAIGPWLVTADEFPRFDRLRVVTRVDGEVRQDDTTGRLMFPFDCLIHYVSTFMALEPGDVISTGTPTGAGARFDPPRWLVPGNRVEVEVEGVGVLSNPVVDESPEDA
jgi:2-keto-4-pentenoate hydratase/2-oxohepta-3-ene-1,7-dioic acid hydratase in catechol pathway